ncbi:fumarylacetoacetate hydrolase family protein [Pedobacter foliorum]|uniref:fumarylacetoacetate hydrolase family protein n=1 Tax=Pedobacter foliorum TaxID=2739058 RepID=UPI0015667660|nr:fumarylacetoacetate hydrolase family protein [Pedobacter foliorum]NRF37338.1 fumarylacetoacetate hydrolase family protein [Pedobacter foliorum]
MKLYKTKQGAILHSDTGYYLLNTDWDTLINNDNLHQHLLHLSTKGRILQNDEALAILENDIEAPIGQQEVWAAGVTYLRSRDARKEESQDSGGASMYDKVYDADRPELFFKSLPHRVAGHKQHVNIRKDSTWNVPEPELTLFINSSGNIQAYTVGNDMSSRSIEGENTLYLPQAKIYERSAALGPCLYVPEAPISDKTMIEMVIKRNSKEVFRDSVSISRMKRSLNELVIYLYAECDFKNGCFLMTGTCIVPPNDFTLNEKDEVSITIDNIGTLTNHIAIRL